MQPEDIATMEAAVAEGVARADVVDPSTDSGAAIRYAMAALFTLSLYRTAGRSWRPPEEPKSSTWLPSFLWGSKKEVSNDQRLIQYPGVDTSTYPGGTALWGAGGLVQRVYAHLHVPRSKWVGLLSLPSIIAGPHTKPGDLEARVSGLVSLLSDDFVPGTPLPPAVPPDLIDLSPGTAPADLAPPPTPAEVRQMEGLLDQLQEAQRREDMAVESTGDADWDAAESEPHGADGWEEAGTLPGTPLAGQEGPERGSQGAGAVPGRARALRVTLPDDAGGLQKPGSARQEVREAMLFEVIAGCLGGVAGDSEQRWYDARARVAVRELAAWLEVPWSAVVPMEGFLAGVLVTHETVRGQSSASGAWGRAFVVAGTAVLGGALVGVTGGLAAPALAAALGGALTAVGAPAAIVGGVASAATTTTVAAGFGTYGAHSVAQRMSRRVGGVQEFLFRPIPEVKHASRDSRNILATAINLRRFNVGGGYLSQAVKSVVQTAVAAVGDAVGGAGEAGEAGPSGAGATSRHAGAAGEGSAGAAGAVASASAPEERVSSGEGEPAHREGQTRPHRRHWRRGSRAPAEGYEELEGEGDDRESTHSEGELPGPESRTRRDGRPWRSAKHMGEAYAELETRSEDEGEGEGEGDGDSGGGKREGSGGESRSGAGNGERGMHRRTGSWVDMVLPIPKDHVEDAGTRGVELPWKAGQARSRLAVTIGITGWAIDAEDFVRPWRCLSGEDSERLALVWDSKEVMLLSNEVQDYLTSTVANHIQAWAYTLLAGTLYHTLTAPLAVLRFLNWVDYPWPVVVSRAKKAGVLLADLLAAGAHGDRPVRLFANSTGCFVLETCLLELHRRKLFGIVEDAVFLGSPSAASAQTWSAMREVVASRLVNGFSRRDWMLAVLVRVRNVSLLIAGLQPIEQPGVENIDLSEAIVRHSEYNNVMPLVLSKLGMEAAGGGSGEPGEPVCQAEPGMGEGQGSEGQAGGEATQGEAARAGGDGGAQLAGS